MAIHVGDRTVFSVHCLCPFALLEDTMENGLFAGDACDGKTHCMFTPLNTGCLESEVAVEYAVRNIDTVDASFGDNMSYDGSSRNIDDGSLLGMTLNTRFVSFVCCTPFSQIPSYLTLNGHIKCTVYRIRL